MVQPNGQILDKGSIDLTDMHNADARAPLLFVIQEKCNMGSWHDTAIKAPLECWADNDWKRERG